MYKYTLFIKRIYGQHNGYNQPTNKQTKQHKKSIAAWLSLTAVGCE